MQAVDEETIQFVHTWRDPLTVVASIGMILVGLVGCLMWPWSWTFDQLFGIAWLGFGLYLLAATLLNTSALAPVASPA